MIRDKIGQAVSILVEKQIDLWLTFVRETDISKDPVLDYISGAGCTSPLALIITAGGETIALAANLDAAGIEARGEYMRVVTYLQSLRESLLAELRRLKPAKIAVNYSDSVPVADGLSAGMFLKLKHFLKDTPFAERLVSAEPVINALRGRKIPAEIERMKAAVEQTQDIFRQVGPCIRPGRTEKEIAAFVQNEVKRRGLTYAWEAEMCPAIFSGPDTAGLHAAPTERKIRTGHLVNMDFGVRVAGYCADLQRTWYVLQPDEELPPPAVQRGFMVLRETITAVAAALRPGVTGKAMDDIARGRLIEAGYEDYPHGLGHQVGRATHDGGALLGPDWERYGNTPFIPVEANEVYTIEPRLTVPGHGIITIEEEVLITDTGATFLSTPQTELWLIHPDHQT